MKKIFSLVIVAPILALFAGVGVLAFSISGTWDNRNTDVLIANVTVACGIGGLVVALVLSAFVALVFYSRWQREREWTPPRLIPPSRPLPGWDAPPPLQLEERKGKLLSAGPTAYEDLSGDMFGETDDVQEADWRY